MLRKCSPKSEFFLQHSSLFLSFDQVFTIFSKRAQNQNVVKSANFGRRDTDFSFNPQKHSNYPLPNNQSKENTYPMGQSSPSFTKKPLSSDNSSALQAVPTRTPVSPSVYQKVANDQRLKVVRDSPNSYPIVRRG